jgi:hypothetical protein
MNTETKLAYHADLQVAPVNKVYRMHVHFERERKFSIFLLGIGSFIIISGIYSIIFLSGSAYGTGIACVLLMVGAIFACKGFLINLKNQRRYNELVSRLLVTKQFTNWFKNQECQRTRKILLLLATEEIFLSLIFVTVLLVLHLVKGVSFWEGIFDGLLPAIAILLVGNTYRAFIYSIYSNMMTTDAA